MSGPGKLCTNMTGLTNAPCCSRPCKTSFPPPTWPTGYCATICRSACKCNCISCCGAMFRDIAGQMKNAVMLLSGGLDSATVLATGPATGLYMPRLECGLRPAPPFRTGRGAACGACAGGSTTPCDSHRPYRLRRLRSDRRNIAVPEQPSAGIPLTYVPARNTIMLSLALAWAEVLQAQDIFIGVNAVDYSGYPDCRPEYITAFEHMANLATKAAVEGNRLTLHAPLLNMSKADIVKRGAQLGVDYSLTVSCYQADADGRACGVCDSCRLRRAGFEAAGCPTRRAIARIYFLRRIDTRRLSV